jgi:hypothetical protein
MARDVEEWITRVIFSNANDGWWKHRRILTAKVVTCTIFQSFADELKGFFGKRGPFNHLVKIQASFSKINTKISQLSLLPVTTSRNLKLWDGTFVC